MIAVAEADRDQEHGPTDHRVRPDRGAPAEMPIRLPLPAGARPTRSRLRMSADATNERLLTTKAPRAPIVATRTPPMR